MRFGGEPGLLFAKIHCMPVLLKADAKGRRDLKWVGDAIVEEASEREGNLEAAMWRGINQAGRN